MDCSNCLGITKNPAVVSRVWKSTGKFIYFCLEVRLNTVLRQMLNQGFTNLRCSSESISIHEFNLLFVLSLHYKYILVLLELKIIHFICTAMCY